jgi:hypothetical protein
MLKQDEYEQLLSTCRTQGQALELLANVVASLDPEGTGWMPLISACRR